MSNSKKLLERIQSSQKIPNDITGDQFLGLVKYLGFGIRQGGGSHVIVYGTKDGMKWHMTVAAGHAKPVDPKAIKELKEKIPD